MVKKKRKPSAQKKPRAPYQFGLARLRGNGKKKSAEIVGFPPTTAGYHGQRLSKLPEVKNMLKNALDQAGATVLRSARVIADAHRTKTTKLFADKGIVKSRVNLIAHGKRLEAAELNLRARELIGSKQEAGGSITINFLALGEQVLAERGRRGLTPL